MSGDRQYGKLMPREALDVVNQVFPNIGRFLRYVLKNEQLGQEAESLRTRYDTLLGKLERMASPIKETPQQLRPISFTGDDAKLVHLRKMCRQGTFPELQKNGKSCSVDLLEKDTPDKHNGHLLCRDPTKSRWHRYSCYISSPEALLYFYDPADDSSLVTTVPLSGRAIISGEAADQQTGKENSLIITRVADGVQEYYLAAFNPEEYRSWLDTLNGVIENISLKAKRNSMPCFGNYAPDKLGLWTVVPTFDIPSNGESSRDSAISSGSSSHRVSWAPNGSSSPFRARKGLDLDTEDLSSSTTIFRQPKPLPSPPVEAFNSKSGDGDDVTIYEDIEELQEMVDKQLKQTQATISQMGKGKDYHKSGKKRKKAKNSNLPENKPSSIVSLPLREMLPTKSFSGSNIVTQSSTLTRNKPSHSQVHLMPERSILDRNASTYSSFLHMRGINTRWERRWFTLQKSVLTHTRDQTDKEAQVKVLVGCKVESFKDSKRNFAMRISLPREKEFDMFLSAEDEIQFIEWLTRLQMATKVQSSFENLAGMDGSSWNIAGDPRDSLAIDSSYASSAGSCQTSIVSMDYAKRVLPQLPTANGGPGDREYTALIPTEDNPSDTAFLSDLSGEGIYDVPRSIIAPYGGKILINGMNDIYDHPRGKFINIKEDEGVYNSPTEDDDDEDIYAYPPDALDDHTMLTQEEALQSLGLYDYPKVSRASTVYSSASTYRDSSMSESTLRDSHASYVTIHESQGQSIPHMMNGGAAFLNGNVGNGEVKFSAGELSELMNPASRASQAIEEGLYDRPKSLWSSATEDVEIEPLDTMAGGIKGHLYRKERFQWTKMLCCIKNNRFECYKGNTITLKLFLPGAEIFPDTEVKKPYALKIKHPRKETTFQFAAESEVQFKMWLSAFIKAASISVQSVNDVEQIRVVDSAMKEKWKTMEISQLGSTKDKKKLMKANTVTHLDSNDKAVGDDSTLQRKKKLTDRIAKGVFSGKRKKKPSFEQQQSQPRAVTRSPVSPKPSQSNEDLLTASDLEPIEGGMKRSLSLDTVVATHSPINSPKHKSLKQKKAEMKNNVQIATSNAGYLLVQQTRMQGPQAWVRYWSVLDNLIINFYPSRMDVGSHFKISLRGSRVSRAIQETQRPLSFMIWHLDSGNRVFCVAENESEFISWFEILTNGSEHVVPSIQDNIRRSASFYYFPADYNRVSGSKLALSMDSRDHLNSQLSVNSSQENFIQDVDFCGSTGSISSLGSAPVQYAGILKHKNSSDNWVEYNCMIRQSSLYMFKNPSEKTPVSAVVLPKCQVAKIDNPSEEHVFTILEYEAKTPHLFAAQSAGELPHWLSNIQECSEDRVNLHELRRMKQWLSTEDISDNQKKLHRSAEDLTTISSNDDVHLKTMSLQRTTKKFGVENTTHSGFVEILFKGSSWAIYWCTVKERHLYLYQTQQSDLPLKSIRLSKYTVHTDSTQLRRPHCLFLAYPSTSPIYISVSNSMEKQRWLQVLLRATQADAIPQSEKDSISSFESGSVKLSDSRGSALDQCETPENTLEKKKRRILKQYDRNMKKTHKFSKQTTDSLKREKRGLVAMKEQIAPHLEKLEGLASNGDERAQEKFVALQVKVKQINAVLPYLEKCITKNKEAEQKTIAILEKKRDEELAALEKGTPISDSSADKSETDRQNSTSDLYMKVLAENGDMGENPQISAAFQTLQSSNGVHHSTPSHEPHGDMMNSTPIQIRGAPENPVMNDNIIPISPPSNYQEQLANSLDETIIASASMAQEQAIPVLVEPTSLQSDEPSRTATVDVSSIVTEQVAVSNSSSEFFMTEQRPRSDSKPPPIKPKKKKVPPPRPPRRSSSYLSDGVESQYSPMVDSRHTSSVLLADTPVVPHSSHRNSGHMSDNVVQQGSPAQTRQSFDNSASNITATSSPVVSTGPPIATRPRRSGSHLSRGSPAPETRRRLSIDHTRSSPGPPVAAKPRRSGSHLSDNVDLYGSTMAAPSGPPPVAYRPRRSGSHLSDSVELQGSPVLEMRQADHGVSSVAATSGPPPVAQRPRRSGSHLSDNTEAQGSPISDPRQRWSNEHIVTAVPSCSSDNKTCEYLGEDLVNASVFSKIKAFEKT